MTEWIITFENGHREKVVADTYRTDLPHSWATFKRDNETVMELNMATVVSVRREEPEAIFIKRNDDFVEVNDPAEIARRIGGWMITRPSARP